ncbi:MAG: hypothetical protein ACFCBW_02350 [Candidatus Competibacterales bacterium]
MIVRFLLFLLVVVVVVLAVPALRRQLLIVIGRRRLADIKYAFWAAFVLYFVFSVFYGLYSRLGD